MNMNEIIMAKTKIIQIIMEIFKWLNQKWLN